MLSFEEFQEYVMDHIREYLPEEYANAEVSVRTVQKLNGVTLQGLEIWTPEMKQGTGVTPTIYLNGIYENYENGVDLEVIMEHIGNLERQSMDLPEDVAEIKEMYKDVNYVKDRLIVSLISAERNVDFLKDKPYRMLEDLAIFYKVLISKDANGTGTITVTNNHMEYWGLTEEQLYETAIKNSNVLEPPSIDRLTNVMADLMRAQGMDEDIIENQLKEDDIDMYVISNTTKANGASVIVYSDALQQVAENLGSDLYILPSSIHEVLALPVSCTFSSVTGKLYFASTFAAYASLPSPKTPLISSVSRSAVYTCSQPAAASFILICSPTVTSLSESISLTSMPSSSIATSSPVSILLQIAFILSNRACASSANSSPVLGLLSQFSSLA